MTKTEELLLNQKTMVDIALVGYMLFLNEKGLLDEGKEFVDGFINSLTQEEVTALVLRNKQALAQAQGKDDHAN